MEMTDCVIFPEDFYELLYKKDSIAIPIDTRDTESFNEGHIPGAVHIPEIFTFCYLFNG